MPSRLKGDDLQRKAEEDIQACANATFKWRQDARLNFDFYANEQWTDEDKNKLEDEDRPWVTFNRIAPIVDAVCGMEVSNRKEVRYIPREEGDVGVNELVTGTADWVRDQCDAEDEESDAFHDVVICGMGWTETSVGYEEERTGKICVDRRYPLDMYWDTAARKRNLTDAKWKARHLRFSKAEMLEKWPKSKVENCQSGDASFFTIDEDQFQQPHLNDERAYDDHNLARQHDAHKTYHVLDYQWYEVVTVIVAAHPISGEIEELSTEQWSNLERMFRENGKMVPEHVKSKGRRYYRAYICGKTILEDGEAPSQEGFSYRAITGKRKATDNTWHGLVTALRDPQSWSNKFFSEILYIIATNAKGGIMAEASAFDDIERAQEEWARPDSITEVADGTLSGRKPKILPKPQGEYPQGLDRLMQFAMDANYQTSGVNLETLGMAGREQAGVLEYQRKQSAMVTLSVLFDALRRYRKEQGRVLLDFIRRYVPEGELVRINGEKGKKYAKLAKSELVGRYDIIVDDAPTSPNQREKTFQILTQLLPHLLRFGIPIPPEIIEYAPLPESLIESWKKTMEQSQQGPKPEDELMMAKAQLEAAKTETEKAKAKELLTQAALNFAKAQEAGAGGKGPDPVALTAAALNKAKARTEHVKQTQMGMQGAAQLGQARAAQLGSLASLQGAMNPPARTNGAGAAA